VTVTQAGDSATADTSSSAGRKRWIASARRRLPGLWRWAVGPLVAAVIGGVVGALIVVAVQDDDSLPCSAVDVSREVLPSVVTIAVVASDGTGGSGTGSVFRAGGYILTNEHVVTAAVAGGAEVTVHYSDGTESGATVAGADFATDLAVLKADDGAEDRPVLPFDDSDGVLVGQPVVALGAPLGLSNTVTAGIVSALGRYVALAADSGRTAHLLDAIQTDASINPGNSGGPLVDCAGAQVGVNSAIRTAPDAEGVQGGGSVGLGFAIPMSIAVPIADQLIETGQANHPVFGLTARTIADDSTQDAAGIEVTGVVPDGPAEQAGLLAGDVITELDGDPARSTEQLVLVTLRREAGESIELTYERDGATRTTDVVLGPAP
jgi:putative serine protease PepD